MLRPASTRLASTMIGASNPFSHPSSTLLKHAVPALATSVTSATLVTPSPRLFSSTTAKAPAAPTAAPALTNTVHFRQSQQGSQEVAWDNPISHEVWTKEETRAVEIYHKEPVKTTEKMAKFAANAARFMFDNATGYKHEGRLSPAVWLRRLIFLETIAGVPGMVAGMLRHLRSLRRMQRDHGWIHTLLEEAENERMHLLTFMRLRDPGMLFRWTVLAAQGVFFNAFFITYVLSPKSCHRFVGYVEEEAVVTYTRLIHDLENDLLPEWEHEPIPALAQSYWGLDKDAKFVELIYAIRADEANHRDVNHSFAEIGPDDTNPVVIKEAIKAGKPLRKAEE